MVIFKQYLEAYISDCHDLSTDQIIVYKSTIIVLCFGRNIFSFVFDLCVLKMFILFNYVAITQYNFFQFCLC